MPFLGRGRVWSPGLQQTADSYSPIQHSLLASHTAQQQQQRAGGGEGEDIVRIAPVYTRCIAGTVA